MFTLSLKIKTANGQHDQIVPLDEDSVSLGCGKPTGPGFVYLPRLGGTVSRCHATLYKEGEGWWLRDGNGKPSKNGVWLKDHGWVDQPVRIEPGQLFILAKNTHGEIELRSSVIEDTKPSGPPFAGLAIASPDDGQGETVLSPSESGELAAALARVAALERQLEQTSETPHLKPIQYKRAGSMVLGVLACLLVIPLAGATLEESENRAEFSAAFVEALGGPVGMGTTVAAVLSAVLSVVISPGGKDEN